MVVHIDSGAKRSEAAGRVKNELKQFQLFGACRPRDFQEDQSELL